MAPPSEPFAIVREVIQERIVALSLEVGCRESELLEQTGLPLERLVDCLRWVRQRRGPRCVVSGGGSYG